MWVEFVVSSRLAPWVFLQVLRFFLEDLYENQLRLMWFLHEYCKLLINHRVFKPFHNYKIIIIRMLTCSVSYWKITTNCKSASVLKLNKDATIITITTTTNTSAAATTNNTLCLIFLTCFSPYDYYVVVLRSISRRYLFSLSSKPLLMYFFSEIFLFLLFRVRKVIS